MNTDISTITTLLGALFTIVFGGLVWLIKSQQGTLDKLSYSQQELSESIKLMSGVSERQMAMIQKQEKATEEWQKYVTKRFDQLDQLNQEAIGKSANKRPKKGVTHG